MRGLHSLPGRSKGYPNPHWIALAFHSVAGMQNCGVQLSMMRVSLVFLKLRPTMRAPPAMRVATCVHDPSGFFLKASQGKSARPPGYEVIVVGDLSSRGERDRQQGRCK
jgi:hypothetical protein